MKKRNRTRPDPSVGLPLDPRKASDPAPADTADDDGLPLSANARLVLAKRYLKRDDDGRPIETPAEMFRRVADTVAAAERLHDPDSDTGTVADRFYAMMTALDFLPNSPTLMNAGRELGQLSACFVLPVEDSMEGIFEAVKQTAVIHKTGGGTGFSFSRLRPKNDPVMSTRGIASGPISFMNVFDAATETVKQGGTRRGANMAILRVDHPDILEFITVKRDRTRLTNFNLSVALTEAFMNALEEGTDYELVNPRTSGISGRLAAREVFDRIVATAWESAEPGVVFLDRINVDNPTPDQGPIEATNPCGEQPLLPHESCNLGSINLSRFAAGGDVDWERLASVVREAVRFLDDVIDINRYPLPQIKDRSRRNRKIGLGVMGFADLLFELGVPYDSEGAVALGERIMAHVQEHGRRASAELAKERGAFPAFGESVFRNGPPLRNATVTTVAPTGTLSILADTTSGIEPAFALSFVRSVLGGARLPEVNRVFADVARREGFHSPALAEKVARRGTLRGLEEVPEEWRRVFVTAHDVAPAWHVRMQAAFQKHTDNAVSKTVNFPENATPGDVAEVYRLAHRLGCKGVTVFRYGSRKPVLNLNGDGETTESENSAPAGPVYDALTPRSRQARLAGTTGVKRIGCGKLYVTVNRDEIGLCEVLTSTGRGGGCPSQSEAVSRLVSLALRCGVSVEAITEQLRGIRCHSALRRNNFAEKGDPALPCPSAIAAALDEARGAGKATGRRRTAARAGKAIEPIVRPRHPDRTRRAPATTVDEARALVARGICPDCGLSLAADGGCVVCRSCGFSRCG